MKNKRPAIIALVIILAISLLLALYVVIFPYDIIVRIFAHQQKKLTRKLLYETDPHILLNSCRTVMEEANEGKWQYKQYIVRGATDPNIKRLPTPILHLAPAYILIMEDKLWIVMMGGMTHCGAIAYPKDYNYSGDTLWYGNKKLIDGLWYFDDGYKNNPNFEKYIESLNPHKK